MNTTNLPKWNLAVHDSGPVVVLTVDGQQSERISIKIKSSGSRFIFVLVESALQVVLL